MNEPVKILGAGLSGLSAAVKLAKSDIKCTVYEKNSTVGTFVGDNIQAIRNYDLQQDQLNFYKEKGLDFKHAMPIRKIIKYAPSGNKMEVHSDDGSIFYTFRRGSDKQSFDYQLYEQALDAGVEIIFNTTKQFSEVDIIAVDALYANVWAYGASFENVDVDAETIWFFMDNNYCPNGYIYVMPYGRNELSVSLTTFSPKLPLQKLFNKFLAENKVVKDLTNDGKLTNYFGGFAYSNVPKTAEVKGKKFLGGSAGFLDPARGFGIKYALESAIAASDSLIKNLNYDTLWKNAFEKELLNGFARRLLLEKMTNNEYEKLILGENVNIFDYEKIPSSLRKLFLNLNLPFELIKWRKNYDLTKFVK